MSTGAQPPTPTTPNHHALETLLHAVATSVRGSGQFGAVEVTQAYHGLTLKAWAEGHGQDEDDPAFYALFVDGGKLWVALQTPARYLSQSIEQDLVHTGDKIPELLQEELVDLGLEAPLLHTEHFRSEDKLFTFRSVVPAEVGSLGAPPAHRAATLCLLGYEQCFRRLGDMEA